MKEITFKITINNFTCFNLLIIVIHVFNSQVFVWGGDKKAGDSNHAYGTHRPLTQNTQNFQSIVPVLSEDNSQNILTAENPHFITKRCMWLKYEI